MLRLPVFLSLLANAAAIDIWLRWEDGGNVLCSGIDPNRCCSVSGRDDSPFWSIDFQAIPTAWKIVVSGHHGPQCGAIWDSQFSNGRTRVEAFNGPFGGGGYHFGETSRKRSGGLETENVRPDLVGLADGTQYNVTGWDDASFAQMVRFFCYYGFTTRTYANGIIL